MKISIIGAGAMGSAVAHGLLAGGYAAPADLAIATPHPGKITETLRCSDITIGADNRSVLSGADIIVIAVKPWILPGVIQEIAPFVERGTEVTAIVAGVSCKDLQDMFGSNVPDSLSIAMPNTAMTIRRSMTFLAEANGQSVRAQEMFSQLGRVMVIPERMLPGATALASCGIAYAMRYVRAASEGGVELGFRASQAQEIINQTLYGVTGLLELPGAHPETEIDKVTTPGGLTIRGLNAMEQAGFTAAVIAGLKASVK